jgi:hypothetical protein
VQHARLLENKMDTTMKMRIAIIAACASTLALAQADVARANYITASESKSLVGIAEIGSEPMFGAAPRAAKSSLRPTLTLRFKNRSGCNCPLRATKGEAEAPRKEIKLRGLSAASCNVTN